MSTSGRVRARKSLGQHWLVDGGVLERIAGAADFTEDDTVIEVGAGTGLLTDRLAQRASRLIAVEIDRALVERLRERFAGRPSVCVVEADVLAVSAEELLAMGGGRLPYVVVGNLPFFIGTAIVRGFLTAAVRPRWLLVTLQAEVAQAMAASPGRMSFLSVHTQLFAAARVLFRIPASAFKPAPKVDSAVLRLDVLDSPEVEVDSVEEFLALVQAGFAAPRKRLRNSLAIGLRMSPPECQTILSRAGLDPAQRPAELSLSDWRPLYLAYRAETAGG